MGALKSMAWHVAKNRGATTASKWHRCVGWSARGFMLPPCQLVTVALVGSLFFICCHVPEPCRKGCNGRLPQGFLITAVLSLTACLPPLGRAWQQRLEAAVAKAGAEQQAAAGSLSAVAAQREQQLTSELAVAQQAAAAKIAELDKHWALQVAAAEERGLRVRVGTCVLRRCWFACPVLSV